MIKKRYIFLILIVCLFAVSAVSGAEIANDTNMGVNDYDSSLIAESMDENLLSDSYGTFQELQDEIDAVEEGGTLNLTRNYKYVNGSTEGINITKPITINGYGHTIDGIGESKIFLIESDSNFNNIFFTNGFSTKDYVSPIYINKGDINFNNCSFVNNINRRGSGGAIGANSKVNFNHCNFIKNSANSGVGGAVEMEPLSRGIFYNCTFVNNTCSWRGHAIFIGTGTNNVHILNSSFINNCNDVYHGNTILVSYSENITISNCNFIKPEEFSDFAITFENSEANVEYCDFNPLWNNIYINGGYDIKIYKKFADLTVNSIEFSYKNDTNFSSRLFDVNNNSIINKSICFRFVKDDVILEFNKSTNENGIVSIYSELFDLDAGIWNVSVIFNGGDSFYSCCRNASIIILPAISLLTIDNVNTTVDHETTLIANVISNSTVNEGTVTFFDDETQIAESQVTNGKAIITYTPTTAGEHIITAIFNSDNYLNFNDTAVLSVKKANIDLYIDYIASVYFTNPNNFIVNVKSNSNINEGKIKFYVDNKEIGSSNVENGVATLDYVVPNTGIYNLKVVYDETNNYLASNASSSFIVNKMPTVLSAESVIFDEKGDKIFTTNLKDDNSIGVSGQNVKIETIKYSGESRIFNGITDMDGIAEYDVKNLEGGMWFVTGTYDGNGNYIYSKFSDKFIVIRMDTITNIEGIDNHPQVNHTYKLKANIHDENGKLVKEGIVQFYLDGVDIGSIDLSKNKLSINDDLLGICNLIFDYKLGDDDSDLYIEYTPSKVGTYTLSAVYGGTTIYKSSNETTTLIVKEDSPFNVSAPDVTKYYGGPERFIVTLKDLNGNPIKNAVVKITINGRTSDRTTDDNGIASMGINLNSGVYITTTEYNGTKVNSTVTVKDTVISNDFTKMFRNNTQYYAIFVDSQGNLLKNTKVKLNINGVFYTRTTNDQGIAKMNINLNPGTYVLTATNPASGEQHTTVIKVLPSIVENHDLTKFYKNESKYTLRILGGNGKPVGEGVTVKLNINGVFYERKTNASGYMNMNINLIPGTYIVTAEYNGLRASNTVKVLPVLSAKDVNMKYRDGTKFEAKLLNGKGNPFANQKITFNINGVFYERITDSNGIARLNINLMAGEYIITSMYENGAALSNKVTISS